MYVCMWCCGVCISLEQPVVWSGLVLPSQFGCGRCGAASRGMLPCMYVCMYGQQVQRSYIVVVLFWRPDLTLL